MDNPDCVWQPFFSPGALLMVLVFLRSKFWWFALGPVELAATDNFCWLYCVRSDQIRFQIFSKSF